MDNRLPTFVFEVEGRGMFPYDMLRYDCCFPERPEDTANMEPDARERRVVRLVRYSRNDTLARNITEARWNSFGWNVVTKGVYE